MLCPDLVGLDSTRDRGKRTSSPTKQPRRLLRAFVADFNAIEERIDTIMREEIDAAYGTLAERVVASVPAKQATKWFDAWRDF